MNLKQRGRRSAESLAISVVSPTGAVRPDAPYDLTDEQTEIWRGVVGAMPTDWFGRETHDVLAQYCRHVVTTRRIAQLVTQAESEVEFDLTRYDMLLKMQEREGSAMSSLATRMRLTQQTTTSKNKTRMIESSAPKPWK